MNDKYSLYLGDCLEVMDMLIEKNVKVDLILTDPPYQKTQNKWDIIIPFAEMWKRLKKLKRETTPIVLFGQGIFTAKLILSNEREYRYNLVWNKEHPSGFLNANKMPLRSHEDIIVFYKKLPVYNPQKFLGNKNHSNQGHKKIVGIVKSSNNYNDFLLTDNSEEYQNWKFPKSILNFKKVHPSNMLHPTEKPIDLLEYLIKTYSSEGDIVLDFTMGSGSTGVAAKKTNRHFIGIEIDRKYFELVKARIEKV